MSLAHVFSEEGISRYSFRYPVQNGEDDGATARNMAQWLNERDTLRHPPSQNGEMAHR